MSKADHIYLFASLYAACFYVKQNSSGKASFLSEVYEGVPGERSIWIITVKKTPTPMCMLLSHNFLGPPWTPACQASLSFTISWSLLKLMSIELMMLSNHLILCHPFSSCPQSSPGSGSIPMSQLFASGAQSTGASASVLPMNIQDLFPLELTGFDLLSV